MGWVERGRLTATGCCGALTLSMLGWLGWWFLPTVRLPESCLGCKVGVTPFEAHGRRRWLVLTRVKTRSRKDGGRVIHRFVHRVWIKMWKEI